MSLATTQSELSSGELHLWVAALEQLRPSEADLPMEDRERAAGFLRPQAAERWAASRWALRRALSAYLGEPPAQIEIVSGENGKPRLAGGQLEFNLSHSGDLALIAVSRERSVGVDVEQVEPARDLLTLAERVLGAEEVARVRAAAPAERAAVFYDAWVRHEARLKCLGTGLTGTPAASPVALQSLDVAPGYAAAVAVSGAEVGALKRFSLPA